MRLINHFGPTEATVGCATFDITQNVLGPHSIPIGRPIWNTQVYVLDGGLRPVPVGVPGGLYIAGAGLARGYVNRPDLTSERFIANPYGEAGSRMYRTGDVARYLADGNLEYLGRVDDQVKIRGYRIELGEIESALRSHPSVSQCAVIAREDEPGEKRLVAYIVPAGGEEMDAPELRSYLGRSLPEYMVPSAFVVLERLPQTSNGKLDKRSLPAPEWGSREYAAPVGETEQLIAEIFAEVLKLDYVGREENFFELGGHSLLTTRVMSQLRRRVGVELPVGALFEAPSSMGLAKKLIEEKKSGSYPQQRSNDSLGNYSLDNLLPLRREGDLEPLFCLHPISGISWDYAGLVSHIPKGRPIYALQARSYMESHREPSTLEEMAADYLSAMRELQPAGPYFLLGWSFGGLVAFEMAIQLERVGESVALLALLDSYPTTELITGPFTPRKNYFEDILSYFGYEASKHLLPETSYLDIARLLKQDNRLPDIEVTVIENLLITFARTSEANARLAYEYRPAHPLQTDLTMFVALEDHDIGDAEVWRSYHTGVISVHVVPAKHQLMAKSASFSTIGPVLAEKLNELA